MAHLQRILNTRQGNVPIAEDYGVPDFTDFLGNFPDSLRDMEKAIRTAMQKYEPRLKAVRISFVPQEDDVLALRFQISARLITGSKNQIYFETVIDSDGRISTKG
jgi:type VI secretion system protein